MTVSRTPSQEHKAPFEGSGLPNDPETLIKRTLQGYLAHKKQRPPRTLQ